MSLKEKLKLADFESKYEKLSDKKLSKIFGGGSCKTGSSSSCHSTAVCNCKTPPKKKLE
ncbi:hypothetical protein [Flavobacterium sp. 140616W15]|uniref:hypothetical protein n=1 Tax=Flavobacterium sp. 140616W15 TaxID=2478552 RepID=UPI0013EE23B8|nr:hypothetical protein [Flavobacterium sp. 140616W15]